jgi:hypothetical protein
MPLVATWDTRRRDWTCARPCIRLGLIAEHLWHPATAPIASTNSAMHLTTLSLARPFSERTGIAAHFSTVTMTGRSGYVQRAHEMLDGRLHLGLTAAAIGEGWNRK